MSRSVLSLGIVGLPNVGKSTLFKALTKIEINIANYPFATIDPNVGVVTVPDERLDKLYKMSLAKPASAQSSGEAKKIPAVVEFYDIAGLVKGANKGEGLGNQFLSHIREVNAIVEVLRVFPSEEIIHVEQTVDAIRDMEIINAELALKDLETIEKVFKKVEGEARTGDKEAIKDFEGLSEAKKILESGKLLNHESYSLIRTNKRIVEMNLLTAKPQIYLLNGEEKDVPPKLIEKIKELGADYVAIDLGKIATAPSESPTFAKATAGKRNDMGELIQKAYKILDLISFFTTGEDETRAWTIRKGAKAPEAAGVIHTDFEKKFIRAEVINWQKLMEAHLTGSWQSGWIAAKNKGWIRLEGKEYIVQDGDVMEIRHG